MIGKKYFQIFFHKSKNNMTNIQKAIQLFVSKTSYTEKDILKTKEIHKGYTNLSFVFYTSDKKRFQIRLGQNNEIVNRNNELNVIDLLPYKYYLYIGSNGDAIKEWIYGYNPRFIFNKKRNLKLLCNEIKMFHNIEYKNINILEHDYFEYLNDSIKNKYPDFYNEYIKIINEFKNEKKVLSHNDINPLNMLYSTQLKRIILIDFEWARINSEYFDVANFFRETNLNIKWLKFLANEMNFEFDKLKRFVFACTFFAYQWTFCVDETKKLLKYRKRVFKKVNKFYKQIKK